MAVKITVLNVEYYVDVAEKYALSGAELGACKLFKKGDVFYGSGKAEKPDKFPCSWAWNDIWPSVMTVANGGSFGWIAAKNTQVVCCTDGIRPVTFLVERIESIPVNC